MGITYATFILGYLAIIGVFPFAGFWSKDKIIEAAFAENTVTGIVALLGAGITAFYMTRVILMTFFGERRWAEGVHPHESPLSMTVPLMALGGLSVVGGALAWNDGIVRWLEPVVGHEEHELFLPVWAFSLMTLVVVGAGVLLAFRQYGRRRVPAYAPAASPLTVAARQDLYGDAFNEAVFMRPGGRLTRALGFFDVRGIDGAVNGVAALVGAGSGRVRRLQTGFVRSYALSMLGGAVLIVAALLLVRL
jgi:NADH-quinone oxidoreductase subunit L